MQAVKLAVAEEQVLAHFHTLNEARRTTALKDRLFSEVLGSIFRNTVNVGSGLIMLLAGQSLRAGTFTVGDFALFVFYLAFIADWTAQVGMFLPRLRQAGVALERMNRLLQGAPPLTLVQHTIELNEDEALRYAILRKDIHEKLRSTHGRRQHKLQVFAELTRLRRFCCHPRLVFPDAPSESSKLDSFLELVEELRDNGHRALVFSQFVDYLQIVREALEERGLRYCYLDGSTPKETRHTRVTEFQNGDVVGLEYAENFDILTAAGYVRYADGIYTSTCIPAWF